MQGICRKKSENASGVNLLICEGCTIPGGGGGGGGIYGTVYERKILRIRGHGYKYFVFPNHENKQ